MQNKIRNCIVCNEQFFQKTSFHKICSAKCAIKHTKKASKKDKAKDKAYYTKKLQVVFNKYIRLRDANDPCISCGKHRSKYHAGHYLSVGGHPELRFNELNVHKQCVYCNLFLSGNLLNYRERLINKIGIDNLTLLESKQRLPKYTLEDIQEMIQRYKLEVKNYEGIYTGVVG